jgi:Ca2+-binding RTX toxin-like protein
MTTRIPFPRIAFAALCALFALALVPAAASAKTVRAELRVLTSDRVLDAGTTYLVGPETVQTDPQADCNFGGAGGTGAAFKFPQPTTLSLLQSASRASAKLRPLSITDEFGFGLAVCGIGAVDDREGTFWYVKRNHAELTVGADQEPIRNGDEVLIYLAPDNYPAPNPAELELVAPARAQAGEPVDVQVIEHACTTDPATFETTCASAPAAGVTVGTGTDAATTGADGSVEVEAEGKRLKLSATRGADIPAQPLKVCVAEQLSACPAGHGEKIVGRSGKDKIKGTKGADRIRGRGGNDRIDLRKGGPDRVDCGPGKDTVLLKRGDSDDKLARSCERTRRR